jgi:hypothetical protein
MRELPTIWYGCEVCGEMRRYPFNANAARPGCRCTPANGATDSPQSDPISVHDEERRVLALATRSLARVR